MCKATQETYLSITGFAACIVKSHSLASAAQVPFYKINSNIKECTTANLLQVDHSFFPWWRISGLILISDSHEKWLKVILAYGVRNWIRGVITKWQLMQKYLFLAKGLRRQSTRKNVLMPIKGCELLLSVTTACLRIPLKKKLIFP